MNENEKLDALRARTLRGAERADMFFKVLLVAATLVEAAGLVGFGLLMDRHDPLHKLLMVHGLLIYGTLGIGLIALGALVRQGTLRILVAVQAVAGSVGPE